MKIQFLSTLYVFIFLLAISGTKAQTCIDLSNLNVPNVTGTYGSFSSPYQHTGIIDNGSSSSLSRHTVITVNGTDPRTLNALHTIPDNEPYSVRLGNWLTGAQAESISYDMNVDTTVGSILLLKYAAVLEDPGHTAVEQPRFRFEVLNQNGQMIDQQCLFADFVANESLGWNSCYYSGTVLWKDWTYVGADLSAYHGQNVRVRLTTYDCDQGGHYGYAYFTLNCRKKEIKVEACGDVDSISYTAPDGFNYNWYFQDAPENTLSTNQTVSVRMQANVSTLCCRVSSSTNNSCYFVLTTSVTPRYPIAAFDYERDSCTFNYSFTNHSAISQDGITPDGTGTPCESAHWNFDDGMTSDSYDVVHEFPGPGTYNVKLVSGLHDDECTDTIVHTIVIPFNDPAIAGDVELCRGEGTLLTASGGHTYEWTSNGNVLSALDQFYVEPTQTTDYLLRSYGEDGCLRTKEQTIIVHQLQDTTIADAVCQGESYLLNGFHLGAQETPGDYQYVAVLPDRFGCDSTILLNLHVKALPLVKIGPSKRCCFLLDGPLTLKVYDDDCDNYMWSTGEMTNSIQVEEYDTYSVVATREGCESSEEVIVVEDCPITLYLPNAISATKKDGLNDYLYIINADDLYDVQFTIFGKGGEVIFHTNDKYFKWDGRVKGRIYPNAMYSYEVHYTNQYGRWLSKKGTVITL